MLALQVSLSTPIDDHAADAIAIALCHSRGRRLRTLTGT
jgi:Holliday junction resolvasome RuvABC endonuclease subunit